MFDVCVMLNFRQSDENIKQKYVYTEKKDMFRFFMSGTQNHSVIQHVSQRRQKNKSLTGR